MADKPDPDGVMPPILAFATMDEIVAELKRRHPGLLIVWETGTAADPDDEVCSWDWNGGISRALGMAVRFQKTVLDGITGCERPDK